MIKRTQFGKHQPLHIHFAADIEAMPGRMPVHPANNIIMLRNAVPGHQNSGVPILSDELPNMDVIIQFDRLKDIESFINLLKDVRREMLAAQLAAQNQQLT